MSIEWERTQYAYKANYKGYNLLRTVIKGKNFFSISKNSEVLLAGISEKDYVKYLDMINRGVMGS